jgi:drug/metabolite transporter (DMT)-like permease
MAVCFFWGTTYLAIRVAVESYPPALMAGARFVTAGLVLFAFLELRGHPLPGRREIVDAAIVGIALLTVANGLVVWSEQWVPSSLAAIIVATLPLWVVGIEAVLPAGERITVRKLAGVFIGFAGLLLLLSPDLFGAADRKYVKGIFGLLLAPLAWAGGSVYSKYRRLKTAPLMAASLHMLIGGVVLLIFSMALEQHANLVYDRRGLLAVAYLLRVRARQIAVFDGLVICLHQSRHRDRPGKTHFERTNGSRRHRGNRGGFFGSLSRPDFTRPPAQAITHRPKLMSSDG